MLILKLREGERASLTVTRDGIDHVVGYIHVTQGVYGAARIGFELPLYIRVDREHKEKLELGSPVA